MRKWNLTLVVILLTALVIFVSGKILKKERPMPMVKNINKTLRIISPVFTNGATIPVKYSCKGGNINPPLEIGGLTDGIKSLALVLHDPDAPSGDFTHWLVLNINPLTNEIKENSVPSGAVQGLNTLGENKYKGPCPPSGTHRYIFDLYALNTTLGNEDMDISSFTKAANDHVIGHTSLTGLFGE